MTNNYKPTRMCVVCRKRAYKQELMRLVLVDDEIKIDYEHKIEGRAFYICKETSCHTQAKRKKIFSKVLKRQLSDVIYEKLSEGL